MTYLLIDGHAHSVLYDVLAVCNINLTPTNHAPPVTHPAELGDYEDQNYAPCNNDSASDVRTKDG